MDNYVRIILIDPPSKGALPNKSGELRTAFSRVVHCQRDGQAFVAASIAQIRLFTYE